jgi:hypothetical protein
MRAIRIHRRVDSETLRLPELRPLIGKEVEIVVLEEPTPASPQPAERRDYSALAEIAGQDLIDPDVHQELRPASMN